MEWKPIEGWPYSISNTGLVRNDRTGRILKNQVNTCGYYTVRLSVNCKPHIMTVHRLVAKAFIPNLHGYPEINHIDGNKLNNCVENLEWCSRSMNQLHKVHVLGHGTPDHIMQKMYAANRKSVVCVETGKVYNSITEVGLDISNISACANGKRHTCGGFHWRWYNA